MRSSSCEEIVEVIDALGAGVKRLRGLSFDVLTNAERRGLLEDLEVLARQLRAPEYGAKVPIPQGATVYTPKQVRVRTRGTMQS